MAATNAIVLSSSPLQAVIEPSRQHAARSSSPAMPSPSQLLVRNAPHSVAGLRGSPIPKDAVAGFASASSLLRNSQPLEAPASHKDSKVPVEPSKELKANTKVKEPVKKRARKSATGAVAVQGNGEEVKQPRKPQTSKAKFKIPAGLKNEAVKAVDVSTSLEVVAEEKKSKPRARKSKEPTQTTIKKSKVTKLGSATSAVGELKGTGKTKKRRDSEAAVEPLLKEKAAVCVEREEGRDLCLDEAPRRRADWTPTKDTSRDLMNVEGIEGGKSEALDGNDQSTPKATENINGFGDLLGDYAYAHIKSSTKIARSVSGEALTKRRKVELVATKTGPVPEPAKAKKIKSPKKKPQTVTAKATAPFMVPDIAPANNLLQYLAPDSVARPAGNLSLQQPATGAKRVPTTKSTSKTKTARSKPSKVTVQVPILLSPDKAMEKAMDQDLFFGTSSQLARDESPTFVRDLQQAMKESESLLPDVPTAIGDGFSACTASGSTNGSNLSLLAASRGLWSVAARGLDGSLQQAEVIDLSKTPKPRPSKRSLDEPVEPPKTVQRILAVPAADSGSGVDGGWTNIDDIPSPEAPQGETEAERLIHRSLAEAALRNRPKSRSPVKKPRPATKSKEPLDQEAPAPKAVKKSKKDPPVQKDSAPKAAKKSKKDPPLQETSTPRLEKEIQGPAEQQPPTCMPNYKGFTAAQLSKEIAAFHFKPVKKREDQISLLERCWESKNRIALQSLEPNVNVPQPKAITTDEATPAINPPKDASPTKKKRGRPPKSNEATTAEKTDGTVEKPSSPAKPRRRPRKAATERTSPTKTPAKPLKKSEAASLTSIQTPQDPPAPPSEISDSDTTPRPTSRRLLLPTSQPPTTTSPLPPFPPPSPLPHHLPPQHPPHQHP